MATNNFAGTLMLLFVIAAFIAVGNVNAVVYSQVNILSNITQISNTYSYSIVLYTITLYNLSGPRFNISLPSNIEGLTGMNGIKTTVYPAGSCHTFPASGGCTLIGVNDAQDGVPITLEYGYYQNYSGRNDSFNSTIYFLPSSFTSSLTITMLLPENAYVPDNAYDVPISTMTPRNGSFKVTWNFVNQSFSDSMGYYINLPFTIQYNLNLPAKKQQTPAYYYYAGIMLAAILSVAAYVGYTYRKRSVRTRRKTRKGNKNMRFMSRVLSSDEKTVLFNINKKGFTYQADIIKNTTFSKVKTSKILSKLSRYGLIKIEQDGRENKIKKI